MDTTNTMGIMKQLNSQLCRFSLLLPIATLLLGCGSSSVIIAPDYGNADLHVPELKRDSLRIVSMIDSRAKPSSQIGTARTGMMNRKVPFIMNGKLSDIVRSFLDTLLVARHDEDRFLPVRVSVENFDVGEDSGLFGETAHFLINESKTSFFIGPVIEESIGIAIGRRVSVEIGSYQVALAGSDMLPTDIGLGIGLNLGI